MKLLKSLSLVALCGVTMLSATLKGYAQDVQHALVGVQGYDVVSFFTNKAPLRGNGNYVSTYKDVNYEFINAEHKAAFDATPEKYLPAYNGYCAYGVSVGKKFLGDPTVWKIVNNRLYLNLDQGIRDLWIQDIPGNLKKAEANWKTIIDKSPSDL